MEGCGAFRVAAFEAFPPPQVIKAHTGQQMYDILPGTEILTRFVVLKGTSRPRYPGSGNSGRTNGGPVLVSHTSTTLKKAPTGNNIFVVPQNATTIPLKQYKHSNVHRNNLGI